jgi:two-component system response regulator YesN
MIKILVADDEVIVRVGIRSMIDWKRHGFEIVGEASDGEEALRLIEERAPDIVLTDIKMNGMDGISMLKQIKERGIDVKTIVLSCHNEFEYVKEAMKLGALDYVLKLSMQPEDLLNVMNNVKTQHLAEKAKKPILSGSGLERENWKAAIRSSIFDEAASEQCAAQSGEDSTQYLPIVSRIYRLQTGAHEAGKKKGIYLSALNFIRDVVSENFDCDPFFHDEKELVCIVRFDSQPDEEQYAVLWRSIARFQNLIETCLNYMTVTGVAGKSSGMLGFRSGFERALVGARHGFYSVKSETIDPETVSYGVMMKEVFEYGQLKELFDKMRAYEIPAVEDCLTALFSQLEKERNVEPSEVIKTVKAIINILLMATWDSFSKDKEPGAMDLPSIGEIETAENLKQVSDLVFYMLNFMKNNKKQLTQSSYHHDIQRLIGHIKAYPDERISLEQAAAFVNLSKNYFCSVFKLETGDTFNDYLTNLRIQSAQSLLKSTNLRVNEIAIRVGYDNINYFLTLFRKVTGVSPKMYRKTEVNG